MKIGSPTFWSKKGRSSISMLPYPTPKEKTKQRIEVLSFFNSGLQTQFNPKRHAKKLPQNFSSSLYFKTVNQNCWIVVWKTAAN